MRAGKEKKKKEEDQDVRRRKEARKEERRFEFLIWSFSRPLQVCYATDPANTKIYPIREVATLGSSQVTPPDAGARVTIVSVYGKGV